MDQVSLAAKHREAGRGGSRRLRQEGYVPVILYGRGVPSEPLVISGRELARALDHGAAHRVVNLEIEGAGARPVVIKELQRDRVRGGLLHADLYQVCLTERLHARVPVVVTGEEALQRAGGILQHQLREIEVACLPANLPERIVVDVSGLHVGQHLSAGEIALPAGVDLLSDPDEVVVTVLAPRQAEEEPAAAPAPERTEPELVGKRKPEEDSEERAG